MNTKITLIITALLVFGAVAESKAQNVLVLGQSNAVGMVRESQEQDNYFLEAVGGTTVDQHLIGGDFNKHADEILEGHKVDKIVLIQGEGDGLKSNGWAAKWAGIITYYKVRYCNKKCKIYTNVNSTHDAVYSWPGAQDIVKEQVKLQKIMKSKLIDMGKYFYDFEGVHLTASEYARLAAFVHKK